jgi:hypothetical protein
MRTLLLVLLLAGCGQSPSKNQLLFNDPEKDAQQRLLEQERIRQNQLRLEREKQEDWQKIVVDAKESYQDIKPLIKRKCYDCHNENVKLPFYGRIARRINPVYKHQKEGLLALDFSQEFPLRISDGYRPISQSVPEKNVNIDVQISYLEAIKETTIKRTMPLRIYTALYRSRRVFNQDEQKILNWVEPLIVRLQDYQKKYRGTNLTPSQKVANVFAAKCIRCHGNGVARGGFGDMEKLQELKESTYVNQNDPTQSALYLIVESGEMPVNPAQRLTQEELDIVLDWIQEK